MTVEEAYARCAEITRASSTSFYHGMRVLPPPRRAALFAVYALARRIDDIADGDLPTAERTRLLGEARSTLHPLEPDDDPVLVALAAASARYPIPLEAFDDLIRGAELDLEPRPYETFAELVGYCRCVAGSIGRLCLGVFETDERPRASILADDLGVAFQLTNILRDVAEDHANGRVYLPQEDLRRFGCTAGAGGFEGPIPDLVRFEATRAEEWYDRGLELLPLVDRKSASSVGAMARAYRRILRRIARHPDAALARRVSLSRWEKSLIAARTFAGVG
ncbi:MAG: squalene synthase HpnD [Actinobacteria bacterium]|nr:squalene synthase HpnD [Actinomycetota bacterium]